METPDRLDTHTTPAPKGVEWHKSVRRLVRLHPDRSTGVPAGQQTSVPGRAKESHQAGTPVPRPARPDRDSEVEVQAAKDREAEEQIEALRRVVTGLEAVHVVQGLGLI